MFSNWFTGDDQNRYLTSPYKQRIDDLGRSLLELRYANEVIRQHLHESLHFSLCLIDKNGNSSIEPAAKLNAEGAAETHPATPAGGGRGNPNGFVGGNTGRNNGLYAVGAAVAPTRIGLTTPRPADVDSFWTGKLAAQAKVPINPVLTPVQTETPGIEMSTFVLDALGSRAQGYLAKPAKEGKFPALMLLQYAGVYALNARSVAARAGEGWLVIDVDSHDKLPCDPGGNMPRNYAAIGNTDRETSYFLNMYLRDSRAMDYLMTRADWDGKTIVLMGTSMGGQQSIMLAVPGGE
jgi:hypothetical protein